MMAEAGMASKTVQVSTFRNWTISASFGYETFEDGNRTYVCQVYCKICAKHSDKLRGDFRTRGKAGDEIFKFVQATDFVSKWTLQRHLNHSKTHERAVRYEKEETAASGMFFTK